MSDYKETPEARHGLPPRRLADTIKITTEDGHFIYLTIGTDPDDPLRPREVFYAGGFKSGAQAEFQIQDVCVLISLLLQHGHRPEEIGRSLSRDERPQGDATFGSIVGIIIEELGRDAEN